MSKPEIPSHDPFAPPGTDSAPGRGTQPPYALRDFPLLNAIVGFLGLSAAWATAHVAAGAPFLAPWWSLGDLALVLACLPLITWLMLELGLHGLPRTIEVDDKGVRIFRLGVLAATHVLEDFVGNGELHGDRALVLKNGSAIRWHGHGLWPNAADFVLAQCNPPAGFNPFTSTATHHTSNLRFFDDCLGCGAPGCKTINLVVHGRRHRCEINAPLCARCRRRRTWYRPAFLAYYSVVLRWRLPGDVAPDVARVLADTRANTWALGVNVSLNDDGDAVSIRLRDPVRTRLISMISNLPHTETAAR